MTPLISACLLGFGAGASFGPVNVEITKAGLVGRADHARPLALGAWGGDAVLLAVLATAFAGASQVGAIDDQHPWVRIIAAAMIAAIAIRSLRRGPADASAPQGKTTVVAAKGVLLSTLSPYGLVLWAGMAAAVISSDIGPLFAVGILIGDAAWFVLWLTVLRLARQRVSDSAVRPIHVAANAALLGCAVGLVAL